MTSHANPDGDSIGALIAMGLALSSLKKTALMYNESPIPAVYRFLPAVDRVVQRFDAADTFDLAVVLDCSNLDRIGTAAGAVAKIPRIINIDHHLSNTGFGDFRIVDAAACSTVEILFRLFRAMDVVIDKDMAYAIYTGILTDTGSFRFSNTNKAAFAICEELVNIGVDPYEIAQHVYGTYSIGRLKLLNMALESIEISHNGKLSVMTLTRDMFLKTGTQPEDIDGMINYAKRIEDVKVAVMIQEDLNGRKTSAVSRQYHVSLRSDGTVDVARIAAAFGGGGHFSASGFSVIAPVNELKTEMFFLAEQI